MRDLETVGQLQPGIAGIQMHGVRDHGIDEAQQAAVLFPRIVPAGIDAVHAAPRSVGVDVRAEKAAAPGDVEPAIVVYLQAVQGWEVVAVELADHGEQLIPTERLQLLNRRLVIAEDVEMTLEGRGIALSVGARIG